MLIAFVILYLLVTVIIGVLASRRVKTSNDYILAGRKLTLLMATATVFATWFGSETVLGSSSRMAEGGLLSIIEDPFGASLCLLLVGLFFARPLYRMNLLTFGDFYKVKFGKTAELIASVCLILSYFGWIAAQMVAIGIVLNIITGMDTDTAIIIASLIVIFYTYVGGMWSVAVTDLVQMIFIVVGMIIATIVIVEKAGGLSEIIKQTPDDYFRFFPEGGKIHWLEYIAAWITIGLGSIPQQDVYQRVMSSKSERVAVNSSYLAALLYLTIAMMPLLLGLAARIMIPEQQDSQNLLPILILQKTDLWIQVLFFGALISAIMSTASGALLAPAVILSENILRPQMKNISDKRFLQITRLSVIAIAIISLAMALVRKDIYELVGEASAISLVSLFIPLVAGLFFKKISESAAIISMLAGMVCWVITVKIETQVPPILYGLAASVIGMILGNLIFKKRSS